MQSGSLGGLAAAESGVGAAIAVAPAPDSAPSRASVALGSVGARASASSVVGTEAPPPPLPERRRGRRAKDMQHCYFGKLGFSVIR